MFVDYEDRLTLMDCLIACRFYRNLYIWDEMATIVELTTGMAVGKEGLVGAAGHVFEIVRKFNIQEGMSLEDESLPKRFFDGPLEEGEVITREDLATMRSESFALRGLDSEGKFKN